MSNWYITADYPGGQFAWQSEPDGRRGPASFPAIPVTAKYGQQADYYVRPAPPDLVEWLEWGAMWTAQDIDGGCRQKVPGGWIQSESIQVVTGPSPGGGNNWEWQTTASTFIPLPLAAHLTVLEARDATK